MYTKVFLFLTNITKMNGYYSGEYSTASIQTGDSGGVYKKLCTSISSCVIIEI